MKTDITELSAIEGNTYPVKDALKALGAKWDSYDKCWRIADAKLAKANAIVAAGPVAGTVAAPTPSRPAVRSCRDCGKRAGERTGYFSIRIGKSGRCYECSLHHRDACEP